MFMLDTDVLIAIIRGDKKLAGKLGEFQDFEIAISSIVEMEFRVGLAGLEGDSARYLRATKLLDALRVYQFDSSAATTAANLRHWWCSRARWRTSSPQPINSVAF
jgi:predicted nucleic acid-binding protein